MASHDEIRNIDIQRVERMFQRLLGMSKQLGTGYVLQLVYELGVILFSARAGEACVKDVPMRKRVAGFETLIRVRNLINHNSYNMEEVVLYVRSVLEGDVVLDVYEQLEMDTSDYVIFKMECYNYIDIMKQLWR